MSADISNARAAQQCSGPFRPSGKVLAFLFDEMIGDREIEEVVINGQTGKVVVRTYDGNTEEHSFNLRGLTP